MTYSELITQVGQYMHRTDLVGMVPTFVEQAEAKLNRALRVREMEGAIASTTINASNEIALPADFGAIKHIWPVNYPQSSIDPQTLEYVVARNRQSGTPTVYAVKASALLFDGSGDVQGVYFKRLPNLTTNSTNWLSSAAPDVYLWSVLAEAAAYTMDQGMAAMCEAKSQAAIQSLQGADMRDRFTAGLRASKRH